MLVQYNAFRDLGPAILNLKILRFKRCHVIHEAFDKILKASPLLIHFEYTFSNAHWPYNVRAKSVDVLLQYLLNLPHPLEHITITNTDVPVGKLHLPVGTDLSNFNALKVLRLNHDCLDMSQDLHLLPASLKVLELVQCDRAQIMLEINALSTAVPGPTFRELNVGITNNGPMDTLVAQYGAIGISLLEF